jgi:hypothetical protein
VSGGRPLNAGVSPVGEATVRRLYGPLLSVLCCALIAATPVTPEVPKPLLAQVDRLVELLRDSSAVGYPNATMVQSVKGPYGSTLMLAVFTIEGFGGGNNFTQYLAIFSPNEDDKGSKYFSLLDVMPIGVKGSRAIEKLNATSSWSPNSRETLISFEGLAVTGNDTPNNPTKKVKINVVLKNGRLVEQN